MLDTSPVNISRAFRTASGKFYAVDVRKATNDAANFFLNALRQMQAEGE
jgi:hypothetical protein